VPVETGTLTRSRESGPPQVLSSSARRTVEPLAERGINRKLTCPWHVEPVDAQGWSPGRHHL